MTQYRVLPGPEHFLPPSAASMGIRLPNHDETEDSKNPGIFLGLVDFAKSLDDDLREHIANNPNAKYTSKTSQNELLECMLEVCREEILKEIEDAEYIAVMGDETTDVSNKVQFVIVIRYINKKVDVVERF